MQALLDVILPVFLVIGFGYWAVWKGYFSESGVDGLMKFTQNFAIPALLFAAIARLEATVDAQFFVGELDGLSYRYQDHDKFRLVVAMPGTDAVIAVVPTTVSDERLAATLGLERPQSSLAKSGLLQEISKEYGFTDHFVGVVDVERLEHLGRPGAGAQIEQHRARAGVDVERMLADM